MIHYEKATQSAPSDLVVMLSKAEAFLRDETRDKDRWKFLAWFELFVLVSLALVWGVERYL